MRLIRGILLGLLALSAACGPLPHPFQQDKDGAGNPLAQLAIDVRVAPVAGLPSPADTGLARAVAENLGAYGVTATSRPGAVSRFVLEGVLYAEDEASPGAAAGPPEAGTVILWTLLDGDGVATGIHTQSLAAFDGLLTDPETLRAAGAASAKAMAGLVGVDAELPAKAAVARRGVFLAGVTGAPGDGNQALAQAMRAVLVHGPFGLAETADDATHVVHGAVVADPPDKAAQRIEIRWRITTPDGMEVGEAKQENLVPAGQLDRRWGGVAMLAAQAAADGIAEILRQARDSERGRDDGEGPIALPAAADLPPPAAP